MKDWAKTFDSATKPLHSFQPGDRVVPSEIFLLDNSGREPDVEGTVKHSFTTSVYVQWDDGAFMLMHYDSIVKIS